MCVYWRVSLYVVSLQSCYVSIMCTKITDMHHHTKYMFLWHKLHMNISNCLLILRASYIFSCLKEASGVQAGMKSLSFLCLLCAIERLLLVSCICGVPAVHQKLLQLVMLHQDTKRRSLLSQSSHSLSLQLECLVLKLHSHFILGFTWKCWQ